MKAINWDVMTLIKMKYRIIYWETKRTRRILTTMIRLINDNDNNDDDDGFSRLTDGTSTDPPPPTPTRR